MKNRIPLVLGLLLLAAPLEGQAARSRVGARLDEIASASALQGYGLDRQALDSYTLSGLLKPASSVTLEVELWAGRRYRILGVCDRSCSNLDLGLRDAASTGAAVAEDTLADSVPMLEFVASTTGPHLLSVEMTECGGDACYFGVHILSK